MHELLHKWFLRFTVRFFLPISRGLGLFVSYTGADTEILKRNVGGGGGALRISDERGPTMVGENMPENF